MPDSKVLCIILGGGKGTRLFPLTMLRSKPSVPIAGKYRLIDIPISNCINSGFPRMYVLTQYLSTSLHRHIARTYQFDPFNKGFVEILAAQQTNDTSDWYQGTADAVRQNIRYIEDDPAEDVLILSGDQLYRMDYRQMMESHRSSKAACTIAVIPASADQTPALGVVKVDDTGKVVGFLEKPQTPDLLPPLRTPPDWMEKRGTPSRGREFLASMGIYLFNRDALCQLLRQEPYATDFGKEIFPRSMRSHHVQAHLFDGYWEDVGTIHSYHEANIALANPKPPFVFHSPEGVIYTHMRYLPASTFHGAELDRALVSDGCTIGEGTRISQSVIGVRTQIGRNVRIMRSVVIGADYFESNFEKAENTRTGVPHMGIGDNSVIENAILDKNCRIGSNVRIINPGKVKNADGANFFIREGIVVIPKGAELTDGTVI